MGRFAFALTSFTAAIPAAILSACLVIAFTTQFEGIKNSFVLTLMAGITLGLSAFVVLIPFGIFIFGGPKKAKTPAEKATKKKGKEQPAAGAESASGLLSDDSAASILESSSAESQAIEVGQSAVLDAEELEETSALSTPLSSPDIDADAVIEDDLEDIVEIEEIQDEVVLEEDDEDTKPKKKRR